MDVFNMTYAKNTTVHKKRGKPQKKTVYEDKSDSRRKVVIVSGKLMGIFRIKTILDKFWHMLY